MFIGQKYTLITRHPRLTIGRRLFRCSKT